MSVLALVAAVVVAVVNLPTSAGLLAWGLAGGDGEPRSMLHAGMAVLLLLGALYAAASTFAAFEGLSPLRWQVMWTAPAIALLAILVVDDGVEEGGVLERLKALWIPAGLAVPPLLVWLGGAVG